MILLKECLSELPASVVYLFFFSSDFSLILIIPENKAFVTLNK